MTTVATPKPKFGWHGQVDDIGDDFAVGDRVFHVVTPTILGTVVGPDMRFGHDGLLVIKWDGSPRGLRSSHPRRSIRQYRDE